MIAGELMTDLIPPLKTSDTVRKALNWMSEFRVNHLPIVNNLQLLGIISEDDIIELSELDEPIGSQSLSYSGTFINEFQHIYEVINLIAAQHLSIVPVLDVNGNYLGLISMHDLVRYFADMASIKNPGGVIVLELGIRDYSLSEIARIIESENASILSSYVTSHPDSTKLELTLKVSSIDISAILASLHRFNYIVKGSYHQSSAHDASRERYDAFMKYLNP